MRGTKGHETLPVVERMLEIPDEIAEEILNAALEAAPEHLQGVAESEGRPVVRPLVLVTLECMAHGGTPGEEYLELLRQSARRNTKSYLSASAVLNMFRAASVRGTAILMRHATPADTASILTLTGRLAVLTHIYFTAYISGTEDSLPGQPEWWSKEPEVSKKALKLLAEGYSTCEIANALSYSEQNISYHLGNLMRRFGCTNRTEMVSRAYEAGVLGVGEEETPLSESA